ncbi:hypothetical protein M378DRAFT_161928 [Amanita muscaria Koide BX008]|uniref:Uncharacterized protein n=1 Tax=Amanita muscaria (strain Koide BX008) TaxID=946122 RepID=A0A0C2WV44_AMAMK|nr:hypothetical protein M378DRAFT_161928 [Amanita muscaria Koide BX008]
MHYNHHLPRSEQSISRRPVVTGLNNQKFGPGQDLTCNILSLSCMEMTTVKILYGMFRTDEQTGLIDVVEEPKIEHSVHESIKW